MEVVWSKLSLLKDKAGNLAIDAAIVLANQKYKFEMVSDTENLI